MAEHDGAPGADHIVVIGGSSGVGLEVAKLARAAGHRVTILARNPERLAKAGARLDGARTVTADLRDAGGLATAIEALGEIDHLVISGGTVDFIPLGQSDRDHWRGVLEERIVGPLAAIKAAKITSGGSITLFSGSAAHRPVAGSFMISSAIAAVEALARALAIELAPIRVNAVAPGLLNTPLLDRLGDHKAAILDDLENRLPARRIGTANDAARLVLHLIDNPYITDTTVAIDGGGSLI